MKKVAITGAKGTIGSVLSAGLHMHNLTALDLPEFDARDHGQFKEAIKGHDVLIHLAWDTKTENAGTEEVNLDNARMFLNAYEAAIEAKVPRVIMASSVHASSYQGHGKGFIENYPLSAPENPYGASKRYMECLGQVFAKKPGLEVVCIRFGGVDPEDEILEERDYEKVFLSRNDCRNFVNACLKARRVPNSYTVLNAVSDNPERVHDIANPFGWLPQDTCLQGSYHK